MKKAQVIDFESGEMKEEMVGVLAKTSSNVAAGWWNRRKDVDGVLRSVKGGRKRILPGDGEVACYHAVSRTVGGATFFDEVEKEALKTLIWKLARFCRLRVLTYTVMGNHFHVLIEIPDRAKLEEEFSGVDGEKRLLTHVKCLYSAAAVRSLEAELGQMREQGREQDTAAVIESVIARMGDLSRYMKEVKERFTRWYNKRHGRRGALWMDRYRSVIVENGEALRTVSRYIELNAVRAELVSDPSEYRWCGWAEALQGSRRAKRGICRVMDCALDSWERGRTEAQKNYANAFEHILKGNTRDSAAESVGGELDGAGGDSASTGGDGKPMSVESILLKRVRYFTDGGVIGSKAFVERVYEKNRSQFPEGRKHASRPWRDPSDLDKRAEFGLHTLKDLRVNLYDE